jgi:addiction module antitoxin, RelB/DinJ family
MQNKTANASFRVDAKLKGTAERMLKEIVLSMAAAYIIFLRQVVREQRIPFKITLKPTAETAIAMREAESVARDSDARNYKDLTDLYYEI